MTFYDIAFKPPFSTELLGNQDSTDQSAPNMPPDFIRRILTLEFRASSAAWRPSCVCLLWGDERPLSPALLPPSGDSELGNLAPVRARP